MEAHAKSDARTEVRSPLRCPVCPVHIRPVSNALLKSCGTEFNLARL